MEQKPYVHLSVLEQNNFDLIKKVNDSQLLTIVRKPAILSNTALIKFSLLDTRVETMCRCDDPLVKQRWIEAWAAKAEKGMPAFEPIDTIPTFTLLQGHWCYQEFVNLYERFKRKGTVRGQQLLDRAVELNCYEALKTQCHFLLQKMQPQDPLGADKIFKLAHRACEHYGTAGYYLLSLMLNECAVKLDKAYPQLSLVYYQNAYLAIHSAEKLYPTSSAALNIAFKGLPLSDCIEFKTWQDAKDFFAHAIRLFDGNPLDTLAEMPILTSNNIMKK